MRIELTDWLNFDPVIPALGAEEVRTEGEAGGRLWCNTILSSKKNPTYCTMDH